MHLDYHGFMSEIPTGARRTCEHLVTSELAIDFLGPEEARVLATPSLVALFEMCCRNLLREFLPAGQDSVGAHIELRHLAPTPLGMRVRLQVEVTGVEGRRVQFRLEAMDEREKVAEGTHERFIVDVARFTQRVRQKLAQSG